MVPRGAWCLVVQESEAKLAWMMTEHQEELERTQEEVPLMRQGIGGV